MCQGGYYLYTSGGNAGDARRRAETDARAVREKSLDGAERVGDKIDRAYDDAKSSVEKRYKSTKAELQSEYNKDKKELGKQVEVTSPHPTKKEEEGRRGAREDGVWSRGAELGGRWYGAFGGFGGTGIRFGLCDVV
jgi:hypothetical protein